MNKDKNLPFKKKQFVEAKSADVKNKKKAKEVSDTSSASDSEVEAKPVKTQKGKQTQLEKRGRLASDSS